MKRGKSKITPEQLQEGRKTYPLTIPEEVYEAWQTMVRRGDAGEIKNLLNVSISVVSIMLRYGYVAKREHMSIITKFFIDRAENESKNEAKETEKLLQLASKK